MRRIIANIATLISLAVFILASALLVRSYFRLDDVVQIGQWHIHNLSSHNGRAFLQIGWSTEDEIKQASGRYAGGGLFLDTVAGGSLAIEPMSRGWTAGGFDYWQTKRVNAFGGRVAGECVIIVPWWFVIVAGALLPGLWVIGRYRNILQASRRGFEAQGLHERRLLPPSRFAMGAALPAVAVDGTASRC